VINQEVRRSDNHGFEISYYAAVEFGEIVLYFTVTGANENVIILLRGAEGSITETEQTNILVLRSYDEFWKLENLPSRIFASGQSLPRGQSTVKKSVVEVPMHWFVSSANKTASGCDEVFIRAGTAENGLRLAIRGFKFAKV